MDYDTEQPPTTKRMRIGTRSCAECRRRKVRCVYPGGTEPCRECAVHSTPCRKQGRPVDNGQNQKPKRQPQVNQKLQELERVVDWLCEEIGVTRGMRVGSGVAMSPAEAFRHLHPSEKNCQNLNDPDDADTRSDELGAFGEAPILKLLRHAIEFEKTSPLQQSDCAPAHLQTIQALKALMPCDEDLILVLEMTQKYWPIWPISPPGIVQTVPTERTTDVSSAKYFVLSSLQSTIPEVVAKAILWFALCIQQLPSDFDYHATQLSAPKSTLLEAFLHGADKLLARDGSLHGGIEELECLMLQVKLYVNMGRPQRAWASVRRAITSGILQGIPDTGSPQAERLQSLWTEIWIFDRQLSMGLGVPYGVPKSHPTLSTAPTGSNQLTAILRDLALIAGDIGDRNLALKTANYSVTLEIADSLERCKRMMPPEWWLPVSAQLSLVGLYTAQVGRFYVALLLKMAHSPYMLQPAHVGYQISRPAALNASREMIDCYLTLRGSHHGVSLICDLMDFQAFSAALVLITDLLSQKSKSSIPDNADDWGIVQRLTTSFEQLSKSMACPVARQAADVLRHLYQASHGTYTRSASYETVIPHFGKVRITNVRGDQGRDGSRGVDTSGLARNTIEFGVMPPTPQSPELLGYFFGQGELGGDWLAAANLDFTWDWNDVFCFADEGQLVAP